MCIKFAIDEQILGTRIPTHVILYFYVCSNVYEKLLNLRLEVAFSLGTSQLQPLLKYLRLESYSFGFGLAPSGDWNWLQLTLIHCGGSLLRRWTVLNTEHILKCAFPVIFKRIYWNVEARWIFNSDKLDLNKQCWCACSDQSTAWTPTGSGDFCLLQSVGTGSSTDPASSSVGTGNKGLSAWSWQLNPL